MVEGERDLDADGGYCLATLVAKYSTQAYGRELEVGWLRTSSTHYDTRCFKAHFVVREADRFIGDHLNRAF